MKFACLGYYDEKAWESMTQAEQDDLVDACLAFDDDVIRKGGHFVGGEALAPSSAARTVRHRNGRIVVTDGPFAEAKEQIGGILILEAKDLDEAARIMSRHPGAKAGPFEIRPIVDMAPMVEASRARRRAGK
jgi:hypothetical protein